MAQLCLPSVQCLFVRLAIGDTPGGNELLVPACSAGVTFPVV